MNGQSPVSFCKNESLSLILTCTCRCKSSHSILMSGSSHIRSVLIGIKYRNCRQTFVVMRHVGVMSVVTSKVSTSARSKPDLRSAEVRMNTLQVPDIYNTIFGPVMRMHLSCWALINCLHNNNKLEYLY